MAQSTTVPKTWPGAFGVYKYSRDVVRANLSTILWLILFSLVTSIIVSNLGGKAEPSRTFFSLIANIITVWINAAMIIVFLAGVKSTKISFGESLSKGGSIFLQYLGLSILKSLILILSIVALIVPFFFVFPRLSLAEYFLIDKGLGPIEALKASWVATEGHSGKVWGIVGVALLMAILLLVIIGLYFLIMYSAVFAVLYAYIQKTKA